MHMHFCVNLEIGGGERNCENNERKVGILYDFLHSESQVHKYIMQGNFFVYNEKVATFLLRLM